MPHEDHNSADGGNKVGMRYNNTFGRAGGATGVHDTSNRIRLRPSALKDVRRQAPPNFAQFVNVNDLDGFTNTAKGCESGCFGLAIVDNESNCRGVFEDSRQDWEKICIREDSNTFGFIK
jgi:hypothetical protein